MKPLRTLGVTALTIAALSLIGTSNASATVLCKTNTTPCTSQYGAGTELSFSLEGSMVLKEGFATVTCTGSTLKAKVSNAGGSGASVAAEVTSLTFSSCNCETKALKNGELTFHHISGTMNGTTTYNGNEVTAICSGVNCVYGAAGDIGTLNGGGKFETNGTWSKKAGSFLCSSTANVTATYKVTAPEPLYVAESTSSATSTSLTTSLSGEGKSGETITVVEGSKVKDQATLSGTNASKATGTVKYKVYADSSCKELVTSAGEVTVSSGSVPASNEVELTAGAAYYWQAEYSGDSNNLKSTSTCGSEVATVKAKTSLSTSLSGEGKSGETITVVEGSKVKDQATLSGTNASKATGTVKYKVYADKECKELVTKAGEVSVEGGKVPASEEEKLKAVAVYYWQATYSGDSLHEGVTSSCTETATVKALISVTTSLHGEGEEGEELSVVLGSPVADTATLGGTDAANATGTVKYFVYSDKECKELVTKAGEVSVEGGSSPLSTEEELEEGTYYWQAVYEGDSLHEAATSSCGSEVLKVLATTSVTTSLSGEGQEGAEIGVVKGTAVSDTATLSGKYAKEAGGTVSYAVYGDPECEELVTKAGEVSVTGGSVPPSSEETLEPGIYYWQAQYSGDGVNHAAKSSCGSEVEVVVAPVTTTLSGGENSGPEIEVLEGTAVTDQASLHGAHAPEATGTVEYFVYADSECKELVAEAGEVGVEGEEAPASAKETLEAGTYYWQAAYSGGGEMPAATSTCGSEIEVVATPVSLSTTLSGGGKEGAVIEVEAGAAVSDQATLSGTNASTAEGSIEYSVYADSECTELVALAGIETLEKGSVPASEAETLPVGTYYWQAEYSGDGLNHWASSSCGSEIEVVTAPITTTLSGGEGVGEEIEVPKGTAATDQATLHGAHASEATGTVEYFVYSDSSCEKLVTKAGAVTVKGAEAPSSSEETLEPGTYFWQAHYSGDANNPAATSSCGSEREIVENPKVTKYAALGDSFSSGEGIGAYYGRTNRKPGEPFLNFNLCHRSEGAWPAHVATALFGAGPIAEKEVFLQNPPSFIFRACSGAVIGNLWSGLANPASGQENEAILGPPEKWLKTPAQDLWLMVPGGVLLKTSVPNEEIKLVTVTIGGNDSGFGKIGMSCIKGSDGYTMAKCQKTIDTNEKAGIAAVETKLPAVLKHMHEQAPNATIRVPLYPRLLNVKRGASIVVATVMVGKMNFDLTIDNVDINKAAPEGMEHLTVARSLERFIGRLNLAIKETIKGVAGEGVPVKIIEGTEDAFAGRRLGNKTSWVNGAMIEKGREMIESFHPNSCGHIALARKVLKGIQVPAAKWPASC